MRRHYKDLLTIFAFLQIATLICYAQQDSVVPFNKAYKRTYNITKTTAARPVIDGLLNEDLWTKQGEWSERFVQVTPYERTISPSPTKAKLFYDDKYIYVGIICKDAHPEKMNRFIGNRDDNSIGDLVSIAFDTYHDFRAAPEFNLNLGGNKTDLIVTDKLEVNKSWNAVWLAKTHVDMKDSCWTAEMRIPFSQLRYNQLSNEGIWGLHIRRIIRRNNEVQNWSLIPLKNNGHVFSFGEMHGMDQLPKSHGIEFLPYVMGKYINEPSIAGSPYQKGHRWNGNVGFDAKFGLNDYTLDVTVNPDYGQVELDPSVMNLTAFETYYEEKRPFFLEGKHILDFNNGTDMMFYTRRIGAAPSFKAKDLDKGIAYASTKENVPIISALKLTGTNRHGLTIGVIQSITARSTSKVAYPNDERDKVVVEPLTSYTVARVQKNWAGNTLLGGMITSVNRDLSESYLKDLMIHNAFTGGIDFTQYFNNRLYYVEAKGMMSSLHGNENAINRLKRTAVHYYQRKSASDYLDFDSNKRSLEGTGGYVKFGRKGNAKWIFSETYSWSSPGFDMNDIGYLKQTDFRSNTTEIGFRKTNIWKQFRSNTLTLSQQNKWDYGGNAFSNDIALEWVTMTLNRLELDVKQAYNWNWLDSRMLRGGPDVRFDPYFQTTAKFNTDKAKRMIFTLQYSGIHNTYNHYNTLSPNLTFRIGNHVFMSGQLDYSRNMDNLEYIGTYYYPTEQYNTNGNCDYITGHMEQKTYGLTMKVQVNVTPDISIQFYGSPFTSTAKFSDFKVMTDTKSHTYENRFASIDATTSSQYGDLIKNPNFSFNEFRSNLVARWEYLPGSTIYFVWEHHMSERRSEYVSKWNDNLDHMFGLPTTNTFMIKMNYWFDI
jgi:hypothetical protein